MKYIKDRQTYRQTDRQTCKKKRKKKKKKKKKKNRQAGRQTDRQADRETDKKDTNRHKNRQTDGRTDKNRLTERQTEELFLQQSAGTKITSLVFRKLPIEFHYCRLLCWGSRPYANTIVNSGKLFKKRSCLLLRFFHYLR